MITVNGLPGVDTIVDPSNLRNGRTPAVPADPTFFGIIEWMKTKVQGISSEHTYFTNVDASFIGETNVGFQGKSSSGFLLSVWVAAAAIRHESVGTPESPRPKYHGSQTILAHLIQVFEGRTPSHVDIFPGLTAITPETNPVGRPRPEWGALCYDFAPGFDPANYPETNQITGQPSYSYWFKDPQEGDMEWLNFWRIRRSSLVRNPNSTTPFDQWKFVDVPGWQIKGR